MATVAEGVDERKRPARKGVMGHGVWITVRSKEDRQEKDCSQENFKEKIKENRVRGGRAISPPFLSISPLLF